MSQIVAGAVVVAGACGDITSANLEQMAATLETRPPTDDDRRYLSFARTDQLGAIVAVITQLPLPFGR